MVLQPPVVTLALSGILCRAGMRGLLKVPRKTFRLKGGIWAQIEGELELLLEASRAPHDVQSGELLAEELTQRVLSKLGFPTYIWDSDRLSATVDLPSGVRMGISLETRNNKIRVRIDWSNRGDRSYKNVRKYLKPAMDGTISGMQRAGWRVLPETNLRADAAGFSLEASCTSVQKGIEGSAQAISRGLRSFQFR